MTLASLRPIGPILGLPSIFPAAPAPAPAPAAPVAPVAPAAPRPSAQVRFVQNALNFIGQPLAWGGGHGPTMSRPGAVDASGLVQQAARMTGFNLDGRAQDQQKKGVAIKMSDLQPGDLVFHGNPATHVGIYVGDNYVLAASSSRKQVALTGLSYFDSARRVFDSKGRPLGAAPTTKPAPTKPAPAPKPADPTGGSYSSYTVRFGDSLWKIAQTQLGAGARWKEIFDLNTDVLTDPAKVTPGMSLRIPPTAEPLGGSAANPYFNDN